MAFARISWTPTSPDVQHQSVFRRSRGTGFGDDVKAVPRTRLDRGKWDGSVAGDQAESLGDGGQHQIGFQKSKGIADALAGTIAEWKVREARLSGKFVSCRMPELREESLPDGEQDEANQR